MTHAPSARTWGALRRPPAEHTPENKARAVSAAAHAALTDVYPAS